MPVLYMPIIKSKRGEFAAVRLLNAPTKIQITPLFDVLPPNRFAKKPKSLLDHLSTVAEHAMDAWLPTRPAWVDTFDVGPEIVSGSQVAIEFIVRTMRARGLAVIPVTGFQREPEHDVGVERVVADYRCGIGIRLEEEDLLLPTRIGALLGSCLARFGLEPSSADLIIDFRYLDETPRSLRVDQLARAIRHIPDITEWRQLIVSGSSMPNTLKDVCDRAASGYLERREWHLRLDLQDSSIQRMPSFGDYTTVPPLYSEMDTRMIAKHLGPNVKYTLDGRWFLSRGRSFQEHGGAQYFDIASEIAALPEFRGGAASYGDRFIEERAGRASMKSGNPEQWVTASVNSHISWQIQRLLKH